MLCTIAHKFEHLLNSHRHPDGHRWSGQQLDEATGGVVTRSYVTNLCKGRIECSGYEKMNASSERRTRNRSSVRFVLRRISGPEAAVIWRVSVF